MGRQSSLCILLVLLLGGCSRGGDAKEPSAPDKNREAIGDIDKELAESKANERLDAACRKTMKRLSYCAVEDHKKEMGKDTYEGFDLETVRQAHFKTFHAKCMEKPLSKRQMGIYEVCETKLPCNEYVRCLQRADKGRTDTAADILKEQKSLD